MKTSTITVIILFIIFFGYQIKQNNQIKDEIASLRGDHYIQQASIDDVYGFAEHNQKRINYISDFLERLSQ